MYITQAVDRVILVPPDPPTTIFTSPFLSTITEGHVEESGRRPASGALTIGLGYFLTLSFSSLV